MKKRIVAMLAACMMLGVVSSGCGNVETQQANMEGKVFDFAVESISGENTTTTEYSSHSDLTVVNFWATWCTPCVEEMPDMQKIYTQYAQAEEGQRVNFVGIWSDTDSPEQDLRKVLEETEVTYTIWKLVPEMAEFVNLNFLPTTIFLDKEGNIVGKPVVGSMNEAQWRAEIEARLEMVAE